MLGKQCELKTGLNRQIFDPAFGSVARVKTRGSLFPWNSVPTNAREHVALPGAAPQAPHHVSPAQSLPLPWCQLYPARPERRRRTRDFFQRKSSGVSSGGTQGGTESLFQRKSARAGRRGAGQDGRRACGLGAPGARGARARGKRLPGHDARQATPPFPHPKYTGVSESACRWPRCSPEVRAAGTGHCITVFQRLFADPGMVSSGYADGCCIVLFFKGTESLYFNAVTSCGAGRRHDARLRAFYGEDAEGGGGGGGAGFGRDPRGDPGVHPRARAKLGPSFAFCWGGGCRTLSCQRTQTQHSTRTASLVVCPRVSAHAVAPHTPGSQT